MPPGDPYSRIDYRRMVAWPTRMRREAPMLQEVLSSGPSRRILDLGCGTGEHARLLSEMGFVVVAIDRSESMLARLREKPLPAGLEVVQGDIADVAELTTGEFGGAICLGNMLPHLTTDRELHRSFAGLRHRLLPGAPLLVQILNYDRIVGGEVRHLPLNFRPDPERPGSEIVFLRLMKAHDDGTLLFCPSTLRLSPDADPPLELVSSKRVVLRGWRRRELEGALAAAGFGELTAYGGFDRRPFDPEGSQDLVLVAR